MLGIEDAIGGVGDDNFIGGTGANDLRGGGGNDSFVGDPGPDTVDGGAGADLIDYTGRGGDVVVDLNGNPTSGDSSDGGHRRPRRAHCRRERRHGPWPGHCDRQRGRQPDRLRPWRRRRGGRRRGRHDGLLAACRVALCRALRVPRNPATPRTAPRARVTASTPTSRTSSAAPTATGFSAAPRTIISRVQGGDDLLTGEAGADVLAGGAGADIVDYVDRAAPLTIDLDGVAGDDGAPSEGDSVGADVEGIWGGTGADRLTGNVEDNLLDGGLGADTLRGLGGFDLADYRDRLGAVSVDLDGRVGDDGESGEGDTVASDVEDVTGGAGDDLLVGDGAENFLVGGAGFDTLDRRPGKRRPVRRRRRGCSPEQGRHRGRGHLRRRPRQRRRRLRRLRRGGLRAGPALHCRGGPGTAHAHSAPGAAHVDGAPGAAGHDGAGLHGEDPTDRAISDAAARVRGRRDVRRAVHGRRAAVDQAQAREAAQRAATRGEWRCARLATPGTTSVVLRFRRPVRRRLAGVRMLRAELVVSVRDAADNATEIDRPVTIRR